MFKKIISQLSLSPATIEQVARYAKKVQVKQRLYGMAAITLAITSLLYGFVIIFHPTYSSSQTANDLVPGGVASPDSIVSAYDTDTGEFRDAAKLLDITRSDLTQVNPEPCTVDTSIYKYSTGAIAYAASADEHTYTLPSERPLYIRPSAAISKASGWCGETQAGVQFAIIEADGNIATSSLPNTPTATTPLVLSQNVSTEQAKSNETATWRLTVANPSSDEVTQDVWFDTGDITEYADITSVSHNGLVSSKEHRILWPGMTIAPYQSIDLTVEATVYHPLDETAQQRHNTHAYDCVMTSSFGNTAEVVVACPATKQLEKLLYDLPSFGNTAGLLLFSGLFLVSLLAYLSLRLHAKELRIIRAQVNTGGSL